MAERNTRVSPLLTLEKINNSQKEMAYITRMRNVIKFQIAGNKEYEYFKNKKFYNGLSYQEIHEELLEICLPHALTKVVKAHVAVHNFEPFRPWAIINVDVNGFPGSQNSVIWRQNLNPRPIEFVERNLFLVAAFSNFHLEDFYDDWSTYYPRERRLFTGLRVHLGSQQTTGEEYINSSRKSTWRRVYDKNVSLFSCSDQDIAAYEKEQTKINKPINVFKKIIRREVGERFDQFEVLESIASPYYYILPHQNEKEYNEFESLYGSHQRDRSLKTTFSFVSSLSVGEKYFNTMRVKWFFQR
ncbi:uncharacterized protein TNCT_196581 [Trichonephila clavata]|uniref:Uncharacterized protein n=1 Tax=Trichonephila clavata TaxID=2740835 RepID=A0A8X6I5L7_TRICU|nr:uncharacterized protein TNCT_196581 [Trichonephila clavata]